VALNLVFIDQSADPEDDDDEDLDD
jgi:hypothetical protein